MRDVREAHDGMRDPQDGPLQDKMRDLQDGPLRDEALERIN